MPDANSSFDVLSPSKKNSAVDARLAIWLKKLSQNPLPINNALATRILQLLHDESCDSEKLAILIKQDPILCLKLFHCTEKQLNAREGNIQHLVHLIGLIGLNKIEQLLIKSKKRTKNQEGFQEILSASLFAAHLASSLLAAKHHSSGERFFLPTLFFNAPLWLMWVAAPKIMSQGQDRVSRQQQSYIALSVKKLGFRLPDLLTRANEFIYLPDLSLKALAINPTKNINYWAKLRCLNKDKMDAWLTKDKASRIAFYSIETGIYLINQYVTAVYLDWNGKYIQRYSQLLCRHLGIDDVALNTQVIELAININLPNSFQGLLAPINRIRGLHRECDNEDFIHNTSPTQSHNPATLEQWLHKIRQSDSLETALQSTLDALAKGVGVEHCVIMEVDEKDIHTQNCYGFSTTSPINSFNYGRNQHKNLFNQLIRKPSCVSLSSADISKAIKAIPPQFTENCHIKPCGLLSVFQHDQPKAIIYCDHNDWNPQKHQHFKIIGKSLSQTLKNLSH
jgi:hypothetical protein